MSNKAEMVVLEPEGSKSDMQGLQQKSEEFSSTEEIIEYATRTNKEFEKIFNGKYSNKKYSTPKDAEKALIKCVISYTQNCEWILEILNRSSLKRTKWNEDLYLQDLVHETLVLKENEPIKQTKSDSKQDVDPDIDEDVDLDERGFSQDILDQAEAEAMRILATGDPIEYTLDTVEDMHVGDRNTQEGIGLSISSQSCSNTDGIQTTVQGRSGTGKSNALKSHMR